MIPEWNISGVLPPIPPGIPGHSIDRSPYDVGLHLIVERFATSLERVDILQGLLNYRQELYNNGIVRGFQWIDGSFLEQIEVLESRPPNDVDVVTFFYLPEDTDEQTLATRSRELFVRGLNKERFHVDAFLYPLGKPLEKRNVRQIAYWYSLWSHRRDYVWKGFLQVELSSHDDETALNALEMIRKEGGRL